MPKDGTKLWTDPQDLENLKLNPEQLKAIVVALSNYYYKSEQGLKEELQTTLQEIIGS